MIKINNELDFIIDEIKNAYARFGNKYKQVKHKDSYDLVTDLDISIENYLANRIIENFPGDNIIGEEINRNNVSKGRNWTIDPIDGTVNLANNIPIYGIQCSMLEDGLVKLSAIYFPKQDIICYAAREAGAYEQHDKITCTLNSNIKDSIITFGDFSHSDTIRFKRQERVLHKLAPQVAKIRMFGSASYDFYLLAKGSTSAHIMFSNNLWDILPGLLIAQEAGAIITNLKGEPYSFDDDNILVAANDAISNQILDMLK